MHMHTHDDEIAAGDRFEFGANWQRFLESVGDQRIREAEQSLKQYLGLDNFDGSRFLDIGSGSGLFSLAARRLGATVYSFDYDPASVACTQELKRRYFPDDARWTVSHGSVLDAGFLTSLGKFDIVYSWGVLHHTGQMWNALQNALVPLKAGGKLYIAIYNTQVPWTPIWLMIKRIYNRLPGFLKVPFAALVISPLELRSLLFWLIRLKPHRYVQRWTNYVYTARGMSRWRDIIDWVGGYPFETAKPEEILDFYRHHGFVLEKLFTCGGGHGCNQFVFAAPDVRK